MNKRKKNKKNAKREKSSKTNERFLSRKWKGDNTTAMCENINKLQKQQIK